MPEIKRLNIAEGTAVTPPANLNVSISSFLLDEIATPATPPASKVALYAKDDGNIYSKSDAGVETLVGSGSSSSGSGELNMINNPSAVTNLNGWTVGTGHSLARNTANAPLAAIIDSCFAMIGSTPQAESATSGLYFTFDPPTSLATDTLKVSFYVTTPASGTWALSIRNSGGRLPLRTDNAGATILPNNYNRIFETSFDNNGVSGNYTIHLTNTATASTIYVTNVIVGPDKIVTGAIVTGNNSFTHSSAIPGFGTVTSLTSEWRRVGETIQVDMSWANGTVDASQAYVTLPNSLTGSSTVTRLVGRWTRYSAIANTTKSGPMLFNNSVPGVVYFGNDEYVPAVGPNTGQAGNAIAGTGEVMKISYSLQVSQWAGSGTINLGANNVEYAYNTSGITAAGATDTTSFGYGPVGAAIGAINSATISGNSTTSFRVQFQTPIQSTDTISLELSDANGRWAQFPSDLATVLSVLGASSYGAGLRVTGSNHATVYFGNAGRTSSNATYANAGAAWTDIGTYRWRVTKTSSGIATGFSQASETASGLAPSGTFKAGLSGVVALQPLSATPQNPNTSSDGHIYVKGSKVIIQFNDSGTIRYKYLDLTGTGVTWVATTTPP